LSSSVFNLHIPTSHHQPPPATSRHHQSTPVRPRRFPCQWSVEERSGRTWHRTPPRGARWARVGSARQRFPPLPRLSTSPPSPPLV
jgi:hypothetical protein